MKINDFVIRGKYVLLNYGIRELISQLYAFLISIFYIRGVYYIYEKNLTKEENYFFFQPMIKNVEIKIISTLKELEELVLNGYDFKWIIADSKIKKGAIAFCALTNKELIHVTWVALNEIVKKEIDYIPIEVKFEAKEVCSGNSFTEPKFRGKGLLGYVYIFIFSYLAQRDLIKDKFTININNITSQKALAKFKPNVIGKIYYLKIFKWELWNIEPVKEVKYDTSMRTVNQ